MDKETKSNIITLTFLISVIFIMGVILGIIIFQIVNPIVGIIYSTVIVALSINVVYHIIKYYNNKKNIK